MSPKGTSEQKLSGIGDPYWYEWSVGQTYIVQMLDPAAGIDSVILQAEEAQGLDDVIVMYQNGDARCIQVKHTYSGDTLTFGDLVTAEEGGRSVLHKMADGWNSIRSSIKGECFAELFTNRRSGRGFTRRQDIDAISRPALDAFLVHLTAEANRVDAFADIAMPDDWVAAWDKEWVQSLREIHDPALKLEFCRSLKILTSQHSLNEIENSLIGALSRTFSVDHSVASDLMRRLDSELRRWTTSTRSKRHIRIEEVYDVLCLKLDRVVGEHELSPPASFFSSRYHFALNLANDLERRTSPVVFLVGDPGSGKTSLVSWLYNQRDDQRTIDVRYHAYRPTTIDQKYVALDSGLTTMTRSLWSDLLIQIRDIAKEQSQSLNIPIHAGSLSDDELRAHVLRIADVIGETRGRPFVIAIDGIDHAAREHHRPSFLASLVPPDTVPLHVVFLIAGQPHTSYDAYPAFLKIPSDGVTVYSMPNVTDSDIRSLIAQRIEGIDDVDRIAVVIQDLCNGNTLASVFAVEEALILHKSGRMQDLPLVLKERKLTWNLDEYYKSIWNHAVGQLISAQRVRLAACLCLLPNRVTSSSAKAILQTSKTDSEVADLLRQLQPLVVEEANGFRPLHNDVRVFFLRHIVQSDPIVYKDCASHLVDYLRDSDEVATFHAVGQSLYGIAERYIDQAALYTPHYVIEGHAHGQTLSELTNQGMVAMNALAHIEPNWNMAHNVACGAHTLEQLRSTIEWYDLDPDVMTTDGIARSSEKRVLPLDRWNYDVLYDTLNEMIELVTIGYGDRARAAFNRWFYDMSAWDIINTIDTSIAKSNTEVYRYSNYDASEVYSKLGECSAIVGVLLKKGDSPDIEAAYARGLWKVAPEVPSIYVFGRLLQRISSFYMDDLQSALTTLIEKEKWVYVSYLIRLFRINENWPKELMIQVYACDILFETRLYNRANNLLGPRKEVVDAVTSIDDINRQSLGSFASMIWTTFYYALTEEDESETLVRDEIYKQWVLRGHGHRSKEYVIRSLFIASLAGTASRKVLLGEPLVDREISQTIDSVMYLITESGRGDYYRLPMGFKEISVSVVSLVCQLAVKHEQLNALLIEGFKLKLGENGVPTQFLRIVWNMLERSNERKALRSFAESTTSYDSKIWHGDGSLRREMIATLVEVMQVSEYSDVVQRLKDNLRWTDVSYVGRKDYSLSDSSAWFHDLAIVTPGAWSERGLRLLSISIVADQIGDNRVRRDIETDVVSAAYAVGPQSLIDLLGGSTPMVDLGSDAVASGMINLARRQVLSRHEALVLWILATGAWTWQLERDRSVIGKVRHLFASEIDLSELESITPLEYRCKPEAEDLPSKTTNESDSREYLRDELLQLCLSNSWTTVARILESHGPSDSETIAVVWNALLQHEGLTWWNSGVHKVYELIVPRLSKDARWDYITTIGDRQQDISPERYLGSTASNIDDLCRLVAREEGTVALEQGLDRLLDMHNTWITAGDRLPRVPMLTLDPNRVEVSDWSEAVAFLLIKLLAYDSQSYVQTALKAIQRLIANVPNVLPFVLANVLQSPIHVQRRFIQLLEQLAINNDSIVLRDWIAGLYESQYLDIKLTAWYALQLSAARFNHATVEWPMPQASDSVIVLPKVPVLDYPPTSKGAYSSTGRSVNRTLDYLRVALGRNCDDIISELGRGLRDDPVSVRENVLRSHKSDMVPNPKDEAERLRLMSILAQNEIKGSIRGVQLNRLVQALVPFVDPFVLNTTPKVWSEDCEWLHDKDLDSAMQSTGTAEQSLLNTIQTGVGALCNVIGATLRTFSSTKDVVLRTQYRRRNASAGHASIVNPTILHGRATLLYLQADLSSMVPDDQTWLTYLQGGLILYPGAVLDLFPSKAWTSLFHWKPSPDNPLVWIKDGEKVAWFEIVVGPVRNVHMQDYPYRQPILHRWVCIRSEWERVSSLFGPFDENIEYSPHQFRAD